MGGMWTIYDVAETKHFKGRGGACIKPWNEDDAAVVAVETRNNKRTSN